MTQKKESPWAEKPELPKEPTPQVAKKRIESKRPSPWAQLPDAKVDAGDAIHMAPKKRKVEPLLLSTVLTEMAELDFSKAREAAPDLYNLFESLKAARLHMMSEMAKHELMKAILDKTMKFMEDPDVALAFLKTSGVPEDKAKISVRKGMAVIKNCSQSSITDIEEAWRIIDRYDDIVADAKNSESNEVKLLAERMDSALDKVVKHGVNAAYMD